MKYIFGDHRTLELLKTANDSPWIMLGIFFSIREIPITISSVLQYILYEIIVQTPHLRATIDPFYRLAVEKQGTTLPKWDYSTIIDALKAILRQREISCQIALFVDALDEFSDGGIDELLDVIFHLSDLPDGQIVKFKVCIASRPFALINARLGDYPGFILHDYTIADISTYVQESMSAMSAPKIFSRLQIQALIDRVTVKAHGVFLWIRLVLTSVYAGFRNGDSLSDLEKRIDQMPESMFDLYLQILNGIEPHYALQAYMMLEVALCALRPLSLEAFSICIDDVPDTPKDPERLKTQEQALIRRITSRCRGLLEVSPSLFSDDNFDHLDDGFGYRAERSFSVPEEEGSHSPDIETSVEAGRPAQRRSILAVRFIHQNFREFWHAHHDELFDLVDRSQRKSGRLILLQAGVTSQHQWAHELARDIFTYAYQIERDNPQEAHDAAQALDSLLHMGHSLQYNHRLRWCLPPAQLPYWQELLDSLGERDHLKLVCLAVAANLTTYVHRRLPKFLPEDKSLEFILPLAIFGPKIVPEDTNRTEMVSLLLKLGVPVNLLPLRSLLMSFVPGRNKDSERFRNLPTTSTLALILGDIENQWGMKEDDRSELISLLLKRGVPADVMVYRFRNGMREFQEGFPALHHCVLHERPELVRLFLQHSTLHVDWPVSIGMYSLMRQDPTIELALTTAGHGQRHVGTEKAALNSKEVLIAVSLMYTAHHPGWTIPTPKSSILATILARFKP